jgi:cell division topological specificity factor
MLNGFLQRLFGKGTSSDVAKKRLKFALVYDKLEISEEVLKNLQRDIVKVVSKYFDIDKEGLELDIRRSNDFSALVVNTPILPKKKPPKK